MHIAAKHTLSVELQYPPYPDIFLELGHQKFLLIKNILKGALRKHSQWFLLLEKFVNRRKSLRLAGHIIESQRSPLNTSVEKAIDEL
jgi:hypothetical protein